MLVINAPGGEFWNEQTNEFIHTKPITLKLEHSLISISNWEMKWHVPYFSANKTNDQALDYIKCMCLNKELPNDALLSLSQKNVTEINEYMLDSMTATTISEVQDAAKSKSQIVTSELIYYWMIQFGIPFTCDKWHINRLIMLIRVCSEEQRPKKEKSKKQLAAEYRALNAARRAKYNTKG